MNAHESELFLKTWQRVAAPDGSTIAYCPDPATADLIRDAKTVFAQRNELLAALERIAEGHVMGPKYPAGYTHVETVAEYQSIARAAIARCKE